MKRRASESLESPKLKVLRGTASEQQEDTSSDTAQRPSSEPIQPSSTTAATSANEDPNDKQDLDINSAPKAQSSPQASTRPTTKANDAGDKAPEDNEDTASDVQANHEDEAERQRANWRAQLQQDASDLRSALIVLIELRRLQIGKTDVSQLCISEQTHLEHVCNLVVDRKMMVNPCTKLPFNCLIELERLHGTQQKRKATQAEHDRCVKEFEHAMEALEAAISKRTAFLLGDPDEDEAAEMGAEIKKLMSDATTQVEKAQQRLSSLEKTLRGDEKRERNASDLPLRMAETALVEQRLLIGVEAPDNETEIEEPRTFDGPPPNADIPAGGALKDQLGGSQHVGNRREERESKSRRRRRRDRHSHRHSRAQEDRAGRQRADSIRDHRRPRSYYEYDAYRNVSRSVQDDKDFVQFKREQVMKARRALHDIRKQREDVRKYYHENLLAFLQGRAENEREAAQVEFDQKHFLQQQRMTAGEFILEEDNEVFTKQAKELRAFHMEEITSDFSDWTGDGYDDSGFEPQCPIWKLEEARITAWVELERDRLGLNEGRVIPMKDSDWEVEERAFDPSSETIRPFGEGFNPHGEDLFGGKWRRVIDNYQHQQDKIRAEPRLGTLSWWNEVTGI